ncbi:MAG: ATP synthase F1 subunit epsilon [Candidatus Berkelbacteria bacterium]|nr:ATP synthase F1 subunit epsilon [Candidatus Berkelbacteria bacterium]
MPTNFTLKLIAPDGIKYEETASEIHLPTRDGDITVLPGHMPLITLLRPGEIIIKDGSKTKELATEGGVVEITQTEVKVLADTAEEAGSLDELKITEAKKTAEHRLAQAKDEVEIADATAMLEKQLAKLSFLSKRKHKYRN